MSHLRRKVLPFGLLTYFLMQVMESKDSRGLLDVSLSLSFTEKVVLSNPLVPEPYYFSLNHFASFTWVLLITVVAESPAA